MGGFFVKSDARIKSIFDACFDGKERVVKQLLLDGVHLSARDNDGNTAVHKAVLGNNPKVLKLLIENKANLDAVNDRNWTALHIAVNDVLVDCVKILVNNCCDVNMKTKQGNTALHMAITKSPLAVLKLDSEQRNDEKFANDLKEIIYTLINSSRMIFNVKDSFNRNCFKHSVLFGNNYAVEMLIMKAPFLVNEVDENGVHAIHTAASMGYDSIVKTLIEKGQVNVNYLMYNSVTPLHCAACVHKASTVQLLVSKGADCNMDDCSGNTALHYVFWDDIRRLCSLQLNSLNLATDLCHKNSLNLMTIISTLVREGKANVFTENSYQETPLDLISTENNDNVQQLKCTIINAYIESNTVLNDYTMSERNRVIENFNDETIPLDKFRCQLCYDKYKFYIFLCGHGACEDCAPNLEYCHICRRFISFKITMF